MIKKAFYYMFLFFCLILNIVFCINLKNYISVLEIVFGKTIYLTTQKYTLICFIFALISIFIAIDILLVFKKQVAKKIGVNFKTDDGTFGTANWMQEEKIKEVLTIDNIPGIILGKFNENIVKLPLDSYFNKNICVFGSSR